MRICKNKSFPFTEMEIIQFHLLVKTFAEILIHSKRRKNRKICWDVAERKPLYFLRIDNFFFSFPPHLFWQYIQLIVVFAGKLSTSQHLLSLVREKGLRPVCDFTTFIHFLGEREAAGMWEAQLPTEMSSEFIDLSLARIVIDGSSQCCCWP